MAVKVIYMKRYITDRPVQFLVGLRDRLNDIGMKLNDFDLSTYGALLTTNMQRSALKSTQQMCTEFTADSRAYFFLMKNISCSSYNRVMCLTL